MNYTLHNVAQTITKPDGSQKIVRLPEDIIKKLETASGRDAAAYAPFSCEIRFILKGEKAVLKLVYEGDEEYAPTIYMYLGNFQSGWLWLSPIKLKNGINEIEVEYPNNMDWLKRIAKENNCGFSPEVIRISGLSSETSILGIEGDIRSPEKSELPDKTVMFYGSSITHGSLSQNMNSCYASLTARKLGADIVNKALAGSCFLEKEMIDYVLGYDADLFVIELGTNCYNEENDDWFARRVKNVLETHERLCPEKTLFLIDIFRAYNTITCRETVRRCIKEKEYSNVIYIDGYEILPGEIYYAADMVHPSLDSHFLMAEKITEIIKKSL